MCNICDGSRCDQGLKGQLFTLFQKGRLCEGMEVGVSYVCIVRESGVV